MVDDAFEGFVDVIAEGRDMSESDVKKIADGRVYDGRQAKKNHLVDELGYYEDAVKAMKKTIKALQTHLSSAIKNQQALHRFYQ